MSVVKRWKDEGGGGYGRRLPPPAPSLPPLTAWFFRRRNIDPSSAGRFFFLLLLHFLGPKVLARRRNKVGEFVCFVGNAEIGGIHHCHLLLVVFFFFSFCLFLSVHYTHLRLFFKRKKKPALINVLE
jgi:hypothetical protein